MDHFYSTNTSHDSNDENENHELNVTTEPKQQDNDELLVNYVRGYPNLWDKKNRLYKDSDARAASWAEIARYLQKTVKDVENNWSTLRTRFVKERLVKDKDTLSGSAASCRKIWYLYESMSFLEKTIERRKTRTNLTVRPQQLVQQKKDNCTIDLTSSSKCTPAEQLLGSGLVRNPLSPLQTVNQVTNGDSSVPSETSSSRLISINQNLSPMSAASLSRPSRPASTSSTDSTDVESHVSAQSFKQPLMFSGTVKNKRNARSRKEDVIDKSIETVASSIVALSDHILSGNSSEEPEATNDSDILIGRLVTNKFKTLAGEEKKEVTKKIYDILLS